MQMICFFCSISLSIKFDPINPAPPVTKIVFIVIFLAIAIFLMYYMKPRYFWSVSKDIK